MKLLESGLSQYNNILYLLHDTYNYLVIAKFNKTTSGSSKNKLPNKSQNVQQIHPKTLNLVLKHFIVDLHQFN